MRKTGKNATFCYFNYSFDLRNLSPLAHCLLEVAAFLRVREVLEVEDLECSILLNEGEDAETVVVECGATDGGADARPLFHGCALRYEYETTWTVFRDKPGAPLFLVLQSFRAGCAKGSTFQPGCSKAIRRRWERTSSLATFENTSPKNSMCSSFV